MRNILSIARYTFIEIFRNKVYYVLLLFAGLLIASSLLLGALSGEQQNRMIVDLGLASIEGLSLLVAVFAAVTLVLEEMESKTLYLILTRPVARYQFITGRYVGLVFLISVTIGIMAGGHILLQVFKRIPLTPWYGLSLLYIWEKILITTALAVLFSLFSTSTPSAVTFTFFLWTLGHFSPEIHFLADKSASPVVSTLSKGFYYLVPNFQFLNVRDLDTTSRAGTGWLLPALGYGFLYCVFCLGLSALLFRKKEF